MRTPMLPKLLAVLGFIVLTPPAAAGDVSVTEAWVRETIGSSKVSAGYAHISNSGTMPDRLIGVKTAIAGMADLHQSTDQGGMMKMESVKELMVPAKGAVDLKPSGFHIMLMSLNRPLRVGETVDITFTFQRAGDVTVPAKVAAISATRAPQ